MISRLFRSVMRSKPWRSYSTAVSLSPPIPALRGGTATNLWSGLKIGAFVGIPCATAYAITLDEVDQKASAVWSILNYSTKTSAIWSILNYSAKIDATDVENMKGLVSSPTIKIPIKTTEEYTDVRKNVEQLQVQNNPSSEKLIPDLTYDMRHVLTLVLDLEDTLVKADTKKHEKCWEDTFGRPGVSAFLEHIGKYYEIIVYSDEPESYTIPVVERLDQKGNVHYTLGRKATKYVNGKFSQDLSKLNRDPSRMLYITAHALGSGLQPENTVSIKPWNLEDGDTALLELIPFLQYVAIYKPDVRRVIASYEGRDIPSEFNRRLEDHERRMQAGKRRFKAAKGLPESSTAK